MLPWIPQYIKLYKVQEAMLFHSQDEIDTWNQINSTLRIKLRIIVFYDFY